VAPRSWVSAAILVAVTIGVLGGSADRQPPSAPTAAAAASPAATERVVAVDFVAPVPLAISFARPAQASRPAVARAARTRPVSPPSAARPARATASTDCSGDDWQQRRGEKALASLRHARPAGITIAFLPGRGDLKGLTYFDRKHVDVFVGTCAAESDRLLRHVVAHELGHGLDASRMTEELRADYMAARGIPASTPWFGCNGCQDFATPAGDFAETYAQWQRGSSTSRSELAAPATSAELTDLAARFFS